MRRLLSIAAAFMVSAAMAFAQGAVTDQSPSSAAPSTSSTANRGPAQRGSAAAQPAPNQAVPGNANPAEAAGKEGRANRQAVNPNQKGANAAPEVGNPGDNSDNNGMAKDDTGNNPASGRGSGNGRCDSKCRRRAFRPPTAAAKSHGNRRLSAGGCLYRRWTRSTDCCERRRSSCPPSQERK